MQAWLVLFIAHSVLFEQSGDLTLRPYETVSKELRAAGRVQDAVLMRCRADSSAVVVRRKGPAGSYCEKSTLTWVRSGYANVSLPVSYAAGLCKRRGMRLCKEMEVCPDGKPSKGDPDTAESLVSTYSGSVVNIGTSRTCSTMQSAEALWSASYLDHTESYRWLCCAKDTCFTPLPTDVLIPANHSSSYPAMLSIGWSRPGEARVHCEALGAPTSVSVYVKAYDFPEQGIVLTENIVYVHPFQKNAFLEIRLISPPDGSVVVGCTPASLFVPKTLLFTEGTYALPQRIYLSWYGEGGGSENVTCSIFGTTHTVSGTVVKKPGGVMRFVDASGDSLTSLVLGEDRAVVGFGVQVTAPLDISFTHQLHCEILPSGNRLSLLHPSPLEFSNATVMWYAVTRLSKQFTAYTAVVKCRNGRYPDSVKSSIWSLHPDAFAIRFPLTVEVPTEVHAHLSQLTITSQPVSLTSTSTITVGLKGRSMHDTRIVCSSPDAVLEPNILHYAGVLDEQPAIALLTSGNTVSLRYTGEQKIYKGSRWFTCEGRKGCTMAGCAGESFEPGEWDACRTSTFVLYGFSPPDDPLPYSLRKDYLRSGDGIVLKEMGSNTTVSCDTPTERCTGGFACTSSEADGCLNATVLRIWAEGKARGQPIELSDSVAVQYAPSDTNTNTWLGCYDGEVQGIADDVSSSVCTASTWMDTCLGFPSADEFMPQDCETYLWKITVKTPETPSDLFAFAAGNLLPRPSAYEEMTWLPIQSSYFTAAVSGSQASLLFSSEEFTSEPDIYKGKDKRFMRLSIGTNGTYELSTTGVKWEKRTGAKCSDDYITVMGRIEECMDLCLNTTGCGFVSYPHWDGCRVHKGVLRECTTGDYSSNATSPTATATLEPDSSPAVSGYHLPEAPNTWNGALRIGGGAYAAASRSGTAPDLLKGFTIDVWVLPLPYPNKWTLQDITTGECLQPGPGACNQTWSHIVLSEGKFTLELDGLCLPGSCAVLEWVAGDGFGWLLLADSMQCVTGNGSVVPHEYDYTNCGQFARSVTTPENSLALVSTNKESGLGLGLYLRTNRTLYTNITDSAGWTVMASGREQIDPGMWYHVACVLDADQKKLFLYTNGERAASANTEHITGALSGSTLYIGDGSSVHTAVVDNIAAWYAALPPDVLINRMRCAFIRPPYVPEAIFAFSNGALSDTQGIYQMQAYGASTAPSLTGVSCTEYMHIAEWGCDGPGSVVSTSVTVASCTVACNEISECLGFEYSQSGCRLLEALGTTGRSTHGKQCYLRPLAKLNQPIQKRLPVPSVTSCAASSSVGNSTCYGAFDGVRVASGMGEWVTDSEEAGAWITITFPNVYLLSRVRFAQRRYGAASAREIRICFDDLSCEQSTLSPASPYTPAPYRADWEQLSFTPRQTSTLTYRVLTTHSVPPTIYTSNCSTYICHDGFNKKETPIEDCGGPCTTNICCAQAGIGLQEFEVYGQSATLTETAGSGVMGKWCVADTFHTTATDNYGLLGGAFNAFPGRPWEVLSMQYCTGSGVYTWPDSSGSGYGRTDLTRRECMELCDTWPSACHAVQYLPESSRCEWQVSPDAGQNGSSYAVDCLVADVDFTPGNGTVAVSNSTGCTFDGGSLATGPFETPLPLTITAWVNLNGDACNKTTNGAPLAMWSSVVVFGNTSETYSSGLSLTSDGKPRWEVVNGSASTTIDGNESLACEGGWHHVAATVDEDGAVVFYVDGTRSGYGCCAAPAGLASRFVLGARVQGNEVSHTIDGSIKDLRVIAADLPHGGVHGVYREGLEVTETVAPGGLVSSYYRFQASTLSGAGQSSIGEYSGLSVETCKEYCTALSGCNAIEYATSRSANPTTTPYTCRLFSDGTPRSPTGGDPASQHIDTYVKGAANIKGTCGSIELSAAKDSFVTEYEPDVGHGTNTTLELHAGKGAMYVGFDLEAQGVGADDISSAYLTLYRASTGLALWYTFDFSPEDATGNTGDGSLEIGSWFNSPGAVGQGALLLADDQCSGFRGPLANTFLSTSDTSLAVAAWINPTAGEGHIVTISGTISLYLQDGELVCELQSPTATYTVKTAAGNGTYTIANNLWQHVACKHTLYTDLSLYHNGAKMASKSLAISSFRLDDTAVLRVGCVNSTALVFAGSIDDVKVFTRDISDYELIVMADRGCGTDQLMWEVSAVSDFDEDIVYANRTSVLYTVQRKIYASVLASDNALTIDVTSVLKASPNLLLKYESNANRNCTAPLLLFGSREATSVSNPKLSIITKCESLLGISMASCDTCWQQALSSPCSTSRTPERSSAASDYASCQASCESYKWCKSVEWDVSTGNCTLYSTHCMYHNTTSNATQDIRTVTMNRNYGGETIGLPAKLTFDTRDVFLPSAAELGDALLRFTIVSSPFLFRTGACNLVITGPNSALTISPGKIATGDVIVADVSSILWVKGPILNISLTTDCDVSNSTLRIASGNSTRWPQPSLVMSPRGNITVVGIQQFSRFAVAEVSDWPSLSAQVSLKSTFGVGDRVHQDAGLAWLQVPKELRLWGCGDVEVYLLDLEDKIVTRLTVTEEVVDISGMLREVVASMDMMVLGILATCSEYVPTSEVHSIRLHIAYDMLLRQAEPSGGSQSYSLHDHDTGLGFYCPDVASSYGTLFLSYVTQASRQILDCSTITVTGGPDGYRKLPLSVQADTIFALDLKRLTSSSLRFQMSLENTDCDGYHHSFNITLQRLLFKIAAPRVPIAKADCGYSTVHSWANGFDVKLGGTGTCRLLPEQNLVAFQVGTGRVIDIHRSFHPGLYEDFTVGFYFSTFEKGNRTTGFIMHKVLKGSSETGVGVRIGSDGTSLELWTSPSSYRTVAVEYNFFSYWHHYVLVRRDGGLHLYVDAVLLIDFTPQDPPTLFDPSPLRLGANAHDSSNDALDVGYYYDLRVYSTALQGTDLTDLSPGVLFELHHGAVLGFAQDGVDYSVKPNTACTRSYVTRLLSSVARCKKLCYELKSCSMFSVDTVSRTCRLHTGVGTGCSPAPGQGTLYSVVVTTGATPGGWEQPWIDQPEASKSIIRSVWVQWTAETLQIGRGMGGGVLFQADNEVFRDSKGSRYVTLVHDASSRQGYGWIFGETAPFGTKEVTVTPSKDVGTTVEVTCKADPVPELVGLTQTALIPVFRPGNCKGMHNPTTQPLYTCTKSIGRDANGFMLLVRGDADVHVVLSAQPSVSKCSDGEAYTFTIDRRVRGIQQTQLTRGMCGAVIAAHETDLIAAASPAWLWVMFSDRTLKLGSGQVYGENIVLQYPVTSKPHVQYIHLGTWGGGVVDAAVYFDAHLKATTESVTVRKHERVAIEFYLEYDLWNTTGDVEVPVACQVSPAGVVELDTSHLLPFTAGDERGQKHAHYVQVTYKSPGEASVSCWVAEDVPPYYVATSNLTVIVTALVERTPGLGFAEDLISLQKWTTAYAHLHLGSLKTPMFYGTLLHVAKPTVIPDLISEWVVANTTLAPNGSLPTWSEERCSMLFDVHQGFAVKAPSSMNDLTFAVTFLPTACDVTSSYAHECCPIVATPWTQTPKTAIAVTLAMCGDSTLRFGVLTPAGYVEAATTVNSTQWTDILAVKDSVTATLSLYVNRRLVAVSSSGGNITVRPHIADDGVAGGLIVGGGCFWKLYKGVFGACDTILNTNATSLQNCVDIAAAFGGDTTSYSEVYDGSVNCVVQNCTTLQRKVFPQFQYAPGNTTAQLASCSLGTFTGYIRRVRVWGRPTGYGEAFPVQSLPLETSTGTSSTADFTSACKQLVGDHERLEGAVPDYEPDDVITVKCTSMNTDVVRLATGFQVFEIPHGAYGEAVAIPLEYEGPGRARVRCIVDSLRLNMTGIVVTDPQRAELTVVSSATPGWTHLPDLPVGAPYGCSVVVDNMLYVFAGNTIMAYKDNKWVGIAGSGLQFDGCSCIPRDTSVLVYGCLHGIVLSFDTTTATWTQKLGFPAFEGFQEGTPVLRGQGAVVFDTTLKTWVPEWRGEFVSLRFDTRTKQRLRQPSNMMEPLTGTPLLGVLGDVLYVLSDTAQASKPNKSSWSDNSDLYATSQDLWWGQRVMGAYTMNLCGSLVLLGGLEGYKNVISSSVLQVMTYNSATGKTAGDATKLPNLRYSVMGGMATVHSGKLYHIGGIMKEKKCMFTNSTQGVFGCDHGLGDATGFAGSLVAGMMGLPTFSTFSIGLANSMCSDTAVPSSNNRFGWNGCNGALRVQVGLSTVKVLQLSGSSENTLATATYTSISSSRQFRYVWVKWTTVDGSWTIDVGRGVTVGKHRMVTAVGSSVYLQTAAYMYTLNGTDVSGLEVHSIIPGHGSGNVQTLTHLNQFSNTACGLRGQCVPHTATCSCSPYAEGTDCEKCTFDHTGPLCSQYIHCSALHPHQPHLAEYCSAWRARGCRSVVFDAQYHLTHVNESIRRLQLLLAPQPIQDMGGLKRCAADDSKERAMRINAKKLKRGLAEALVKGYGEGIVFCKAQEGEMEMRMMYEFAKVVGQEHIPRFIERLNEMLDKHDDSAALWLAEAINTLKSRTVDPLTQGRISCMLLRLPASVGLAATCSPGCAPPSEAIIEDLPYYTGTVRNIASSAQGLSNYPHFTAALSKVHDSQQSPSTSEGFSVSQETESSGMLWNARKSSEALLKAMVVGQSIVGHMLDTKEQAQVMQNKTMQNAESLLKAAVAGVTKSLGANGAEHVVCEGMREYVWKARKNNGHKPFDMASSSTRSNTLTLPKAPRHSLKTTVTLDAFLKSEPSSEIISDNLPTCEEFLSHAALHIHPEAGMEEEYWISRNPLYIWRAARLLHLNPTCSMDKDSWSTEHKYIESSIEKYYPKLGAETLAKLS